jgi:hypothetical protein
MHSTRLARAVPGDPRLEVSTSRSPSTACLLAASARSSGSCTHGHVGSHSPWPLGVDSLSPLTLGGRAGGSHPSSGCTTTTARRELRGADLRRGFFLLDAPAGLLSLWPSSRSWAPRGHSCSRKPRSRHQSRTTPMVAKQKASHRSLATRRWSTAPPSPPFVEAPPAAAAPLESAAGAQDTRVGVGAAS